MDHFFIQFFWCFRAESVHCSRVWGLSMSIHQSDSHVTSPVRMREGLQRCSYRCPCRGAMRRPMPTLEHAMAPHTSDPDASACSLCLLFCLQLSRSHRIHSSVILHHRRQQIVAFPNGALSDLPACLASAHRPTQPARFGSRRSLPLVSWAYFGISSPG
jgi:hypothetical protein